MCKVSVIIPVYNTEAYIGRCLESVLQQTLRDIEVIVVNDATTDNAMKIVSIFAEMDSRIIILDNKEWKGPSIARQQGYSYGRGSYFFFLDSDDTLPKNALENLYLAAENDGADIVKGGIVFVKTSGIQLPWIKNTLPWGGEKLGVYQALLRGTLTHNLCGGLYRRDLLLGYNYVSVPCMTHGEDALFFYQLAENAKKTIIVPNCVYFYQENMTSSTHRDISDRSLGLLVGLYDFIYDRLMNYPILRNDLIRYLVWNLNELGVNYGVSRVVRVAQGSSNVIGFLSLFHRLRHLSPKENVRWIIKYVLRVLRK